MGPSAGAASPSPGDTLDALYPGSSPGNAAHCRAHLAGNGAFIVAGDRRADGTSLCAALAELSPRGGDARNINLSAAGDTAWFDERLSAPAGASAAASGVLVRREGRWLVAQYHLSLNPATAAAQVAPAGAAAAASAPAAASEPDKPACRKLRHKTNKVANC